MMLNQIGFGGPAKFAGKLNFDLEVPNPHTDKHAAFAEYLATYGRSYASKSEVDTRFGIFSENYDQIMKHNANPDRGFEKAINQFADLSEEEFRARYLSSYLEVPKDLKPKPHLLRSSNSAVPAEVNWYAANKVSDSVDQTSCGSCWAFTTATTLESLFAIRNDVAAPTYSVQYLLDCDELNFGCEGGWMTDSYNWTKENGIIAWDDYSRTYQARTNKCSKIETSVHRFYNEGAFEEATVTNERLKELIAQQPVGAAFYSNYGCMNFYKSGVLMDSDCDCSDPRRKEVNHAVTIVGYGLSDRQGCNEYWLIKNSWGSRWGEKGGLFKLCADRQGFTEELGTCQINSFIMWPQ